MDDADIADAAREFFRHKCQKADKYDGGEDERSMLCRMAKYRLYGLLYQDWVETNHDEIAAEARRYREVFDD